ILAISLPDSAISMSVARQASDAPGNSTIVALSPLLKSPTPIPQRIKHTPPPTSVATVAPQLSAIVINGGNLRMRPTLQGKVLDQVHAREMVTLLARTGDGAWYQVSDERAVVGYVHESLLNVDQQVAAQVPVVAP
ncbi:MAG: SH3 domain-containing protein, partial [Roseiflexaceae bacterium]